MYETFFGLAREPFSVAPDPRFLYMSAQHREALEHLNYGLRRGGGFVVLTGEIGAGKTTVWRCFLEQLPPELDVAYVVNPKLGVEALLARVCEDLRVELPAEAKVVDPIDALHGHLLLAHAQGRRTLVVVDEAQALSLEVLEQLRLLTNLDTRDRKLVQVLLIGQPELRTLLEKPVLEPLAQRVVARFHLPALAEAETTRYIAHRLAVAGLSGELPFDAEALARIHELCGGVPRRINVLCDRALIAAHGARSPRVDRRLVDLAAGAVFGRQPGAGPVASPPAGGSADASAPPPPAAGSGRQAWLAVAGVAAFALLVMALTPWLRGGGGPTPAAPPAQAAPGTPPAGEGRSALATAPPAPPPAPAVAAPALPAAADGAQALEGLLAAGGDEARAWRGLAGLWGSTLPPGVEPCSAAPAQGLRCYRGRGGLLLVRQLARPGILKLVDEQGRSAQVLLVGLDDSRAWLRGANGADQAVPLAQLARAWRGEFSTLWRAPPGYREAEGTEAAAQLGPWLARQIGIAEGAGAAASAPAAGTELRDRLHAFQLAQGLQPDGLAGPLTLMQLNRASGIDEPRLAARR